MKLPGQRSRAGALIALLRVWGCGAQPTTVEIPAARSLEERSRAPRPVPVAEPVPDHLSIEQAVDEVLQRYLTLLAQRLSLSVADAAIVAARLRPNPVLSLDVDHVSITHISKGDLTEAAARVDVPIVLGG